MPDSFEGITKSAAPGLCGQQVNIGHAQQFTEVLHRLYNGRKLQLFTCKLELRTHYAIATNSEDDVVAMREAARDLREPGAGSADARSQPTHGRANAGADSGCQAIWRSINS